MSGLCVLHQGNWLNLENTCEPFQNIIVLANKKLEEITHGEIQAAVHAVDKNTQPRVSLVYELREKVESSDENKTI